MKKFYSITLLILFISVLFSSLASAIQLNQLEGFENGGSLPANWYVYQEGTNSWGVSTTDPFNGTYHAQVVQPGTSTTAYLEARLDTTDYAGITFTYYRRLIGLDTADEFQAQWYDGSTWYVLEATGDSSANDASYIYRNYTLPVGAGDNPDFAIRFTCMAGAVSEFCRVDDVLIIATEQPNPVEPIAEVTYNYTIINTTNGFEIVVTPLFNKSGVMTPINTSLRAVPLETAYESGVPEGLYEAYFKNLPSTTSSVLLRRGIEIAYDPNGLYWNSASGDDIIDAEPSGDGSISISDPTTFVYPNSYGTGINLTYTYTPTELKENLVIANRAAIGNPSDPVAAGANLTFRMDFALHNVNDADLYVDGNYWATNGELDAQTAYFKYDNQIIFRLAPVIATDSAGNNVSGHYHFRRTLGDLWIEVHIPFSWINDTARTYPIIIDPTTYIDAEGHLVIDLSDETYNPLEEIELMNITGEGEVLIATNLTTADYAINPLIDFEQGIVITKTSEGTTLLKCPNWNFTGEYCGDCTSWEEGVCVQTENDTWSYLQELSIGQSYNFTLAPGDPAYVEIGSPGESTTTSATPVNKTTLNIPVGEINPYATGWPYAIFWHATSMITSATLSTYLHLLLDDTNTSQQVTESEASASTVFYLNKGGLWVGNLSSANHTATIQYWSQTAGTSSVIRNAYITALMIPSDGIYAQNNTNVALTTTPARTFHKDFNVSTAQEYWFFGSVITDSDGVSNTTFKIDDSVIGGGNLRNTKDTRDYYGFHAQKIINLSAGYHNMSIWGASTTTGADYNREHNLLMIPLNRYWYYWNSTEGTSTVTAGTYTPYATINFNITIPGEYLVMTTAAPSQANANQEIITRMTVDGTSYCEDIYQPTAANDYHSFMCTQSINFTAGLHNATIDSYITGSTGYIKNPRIMIISKDVCNPKPDVDWLIEKPIVCDAVNRTTGTGKTIITGTGTLELKNSANITTKGYTLLERGASLWKIMIQRLSKLIITR